MKQHHSTGLRAGGAILLAIGLAACLEPYPLPPGGPHPRPPRPGPPMPPPPGGVSFSRTGTVSRHAPFDTCMEGNVNYDLRSGPRAYRLSAYGNPRNLEILEHAVRTGSPVQVTGIRRRGVRPECDYIVVTRVSSARW